MLRRTARLVYPALSVWPWAVPMRAAIAPLVVLTALLPRLAQSQLLGFDAHLVSATATCAVAGDSENFVSVADGAADACFDSIEMGEENTLRIDRSSSDVVLLEFAVGNRNCASTSSVSFPSGSFTLCSSIDVQTFPGRDVVGTYSFSFNTGVELTFAVNTNPAVFPAGTQVTLNELVLPEEGDYVATGTNFDLIISVDADADLSLLGDVQITGATTVGDEDGDGVLDPDDLCPGSQTSRVDEFGCSDAQNLGICEADLDEALETLGQCEEDLAAALADEDGDGEGDATDACADTPASAAVDSDGCSQDQFCALIDVSTGRGRRACRLSDWRNDEPVGAGDCRFRKGECEAAP